jgi:site-specific DNA-cytosine methylase
VLEPDRARPGLNPGFVPLRRRQTWPTNRPGPTLTTQTVSAVYGQVIVELRDGTARQPTVADLLALSGFPPDFRFPDDSLERAWRALGNCVPPPLAEAWAQSVGAALTA